MKSSNVVLCSVLRRFKSKNNKTLGDQPSQNIQKGQHPSSRQSPRSLRDAEWQRIFQNNLNWSRAKLAQDPDYFQRLCNLQRPEFLWIGCADSRVPANEIVGLQPGEIFVHRNIANLVIATDINAQSVIEYAVRNLQIKHIIVCGHYGCAGVDFALKAQNAGFLNPWITHIRDVFGSNKSALEKIEDPGERLKRLVELNTVEGCMTLMKNFTVQESYHKFGFPIVHACVYDLSNGILKDLEIDFVVKMEKFKSVYWLVSDEEDAL